MTFHVDAWYALPLAWVAIAFGYIFMHSITLPAIHYYNQLYGAPWGVFILFKRIFIKPFFLGFFSSLYPNYVNAFNDELTQGTPRFPPTIRGGWFASVKYSELYEAKTDRFGIMLATPFVIIIALLINFHPIIMLTSIFYFNMIIGWIVYPKVFDPGVGKFLSGWYEYVRYGNNPFKKFAKGIIALIDVASFFFYAQYRAWKDIFSSLWHGGWSGKRWMAVAIPLAIIALWINSYITLGILGAGLIKEIIQKVYVGFKIGEQYKKIVEGVKTLNKKNEYRSYEPIEGKKSIDFIAEEFNTVNDKWFRHALDRFIAENGILGGLIVDAGEMASNTRFNVARDLLHAINGRIAKIKKLNDRKTKKLDKLKKEDNVSNERISKIEESIDKNTKKLGDLNKQKSDLEVEIKALALHSDLARTSKDMRHYYNGVYKFIPAVGKVDEIYAGNIRKCQVEKAGFDWGEVSKKLIQNGWAEQQGNDAVRLKVNLEKESVSKIFGDKFWLILQQAYNPSLIPSFIREHKTGFKISLVLGAAAYLVAYGATFIYDIFDLGILGEWIFASLGYVWLLPAAAFMIFKVIQNIVKIVRSEEHTSELQSHSFISYAVFCLKKKKSYKNC